MQRVTASQASFSNVIGEPGHKTTRRQGRPGTGYCGLFGCVLLSTLIEGLPVPRETGNLPSQPWLADYPFGLGLFHQL